MLAPLDFFDLKEFAHADLFADLTHVWEAIDRLPAYLAKVFDISPEDLRKEPTRFRDLVQASPEAMIEDGAILLGPALIGPGSRLYAGSLVRGPVILGRDAIVGHGSEVRGSVLLDGAAVPHLNYVGDSLLGAHVNLGAGSVCSNVKLGRGAVRVRVGDTEHDTGLERLGAVLGDRVELGCHVVLNPGTLIGPRTHIYPNASLRGYYPQDHIIKVHQELQIVPRH